MKLFKEDEPAAPKLADRSTLSGSPVWEPEWPGGRPIAQWTRLEAGYSDDLGTGKR